MSRKTIFAIAFVLVILAGVIIGNTFFSSEAMVVEVFKNLNNSQQVILVTTEGYNTNVAKIETFEKQDGKWTQKLSISGVIGKKGFAKNKVEGDKKSPTGKYTVGTVFGRYNNPGVKLPYHQITKDDVWVDDSSSEHYNTLQKNPTMERWKSAENMNIKPYNYGFVIDYNTKRVPNKGSAIFFHVIGEKNYTAGCTATTQENVVKIIKWLDSKKNPVIIQSPRNELEKY